MNKVYGRFTFCLFLTCLSTVLYAQQKKLSDAEKRILVANFISVIADVKNDFRNLAVGEVKEYRGTRLSASKVTLLPAYYELNKIYSIYWGMDDVDKNEKRNYFLDISPFSIDEMLSSLSATLTSAGFTEVQPQRVEDIDSIRAFRSKEVVVVFKGAKDMLDKSTSIYIGKLHFYYSPSVSAVKPMKTAVKNNVDFVYQHSCGMQVKGKYISGDSLINGQIIFCSKESSGPATFTGTFLNRGYLPRTYIGNASGNLPMKFEPVKGQLKLQKWGVSFYGDFFKVLPEKNVYAAGLLIVNGDSLRGFLYRNSGYEPVYSFIPIDKNTKKIDMYADYQRTDQPRLVYQNKTVAEEEQELADSERRANDRQNKGGSGGTDTRSPEYKRMVEVATEARIKLFEWIRVNDKAREEDVRQCIKDRGYGASIARMSGHCNRAMAYFADHNGKCYDYLKKYEKYTPSEQLSDIKSRIQAVNDAMKGIR